MLEGQPADVADLLARHCGVHVGSSLGEVPSQRKLEAAESLSEWVVKEFKVEERKWPGEDC